MPEALAIGAIALENDRMPVALVPVLAVTVVSESASFSTGPG